MNDDDADIFDYGFIGAAVVAIIMVYIIVSLILGGISGAIAIAVLEMSNEKETYHLFMGGFMVLIPLLPLLGYVVVNVKPWFE